ncbi:MAG: GTP cyclohydrolase I FolE2 [Proteobacteria bacterium]|nr:GTP cyclohydrolase I FolE2 [Pseudomonadota bacterium]MBU4294799.1 GTP cyclohydrolase I FolE2 [Pseudomonadota bacterium]MCG2748077.1 GTP cyclohydrolase I FolE2 [Desulfobulbaceae bacterium]
MPRVIRIDGEPSLIDRETHEKVLASGNDVPEQAPSFAIHLDEVGIAGKTLWVLLPEGRLPFTASITVDLPGQTRGIHMSRLEQAVAELHERPFARLSHYARALVEKVVERQRGRTARVSLTGKRPLLRQAKISRQVSVDPLLVKVEAMINRDDPEGITVTNGIGVSHITSCPCTQVYNLDVFTERGNCPMPTHSQRSQTWLHLRCAGEVPAYEELLTCLENSLHLTQDLLKRPDEAEIVLKSHIHPQFAEDVVRETAREVGRIFGAVLPSDTGVIIESLSLESIHIHDVCCRLETSLGAICSLL